VTLNYAASMTALARASGAETVKALLGAVHLPRFTVAELAEQTGVSRRTVDTVMRRYSHIFDRVGQQEPDRPGRPAVRWCLKEDRIDEVIEQIETMRRALTVPDRASLVEAPDADLATASLEMAATSLGRLLAEVSPDDKAHLLTKARRSLAAAGYPPDGDVRVSQPDERMRETASFIGSVADIVEAKEGASPDQLDIAHARALSLALAARGQMRASHWLPLARLVTSHSGTVMWPAVCVERRSEDLIRRLFPRLRRDRHRDTHLPDWVTLADTRARRAPASGEVMPLLFASNAADLLPLRDHPHGLPPYVVIGREVRLFDQVSQLRGRFVLERDARTTQTDAAEAVNRLALGLD
jgi:hypothetical protein